MDNLILVTDWEKVDKDDKDNFFLTEEWRQLIGMSKKEFMELKKKVTGGYVYIGYIVEAKNYCIYNQMDAHQVFINDEMDVLINCESAIISNNHTKRIEFSY